MWYCNDIRVCEGSMTWRLSWRDNLEFNDTINSKNKKGILWPESKRGFIDVCQLLDHNNGLKTQGINIVGSCYIQKKNRLNYKQSALSSLTTYM